MGQKRPYPKPPAPRPCALCYGALSDNETHIHDRHRDTELGRKYLAQLHKPKIRPQPIEPKVEKPKARTRSKRSDLLTKLEQQVVALLADGYSRKHIAILLDVPAEVVSSRLYRAKKQAGAKTLYQLVVWYKETLDIQEEDHGGNRRTGRAGNHEDRPVGTPESREATAA